jgi:hypothetical protein
MTFLFKRTTAFALVLMMISVSAPGLEKSASAQDKGPMSLLAVDALVAPNQEAIVKVKGVVDDGKGKAIAVAGEPLELLSDGKVVGRAVTDAKGLAEFHITPKAKGAASLTIHTAASARATAEGKVTVAAWEHRNPVLAVELGALEKDVTTHEPDLDAADELGKLTLFYYHLLYVVSAPDPVSDEFQISTTTRQWLAAHRFPPGYILVVPPTAGAFGSRLDQFRAIGWSGLKAGIGRSRQFAETFLERRLEAVMVPEPPKGEQLKKAKIAKEWKEVRRKL